MTYEKYVMIRNSRGLKDADVAKGTGIAASTFSDWKSGRSMPKMLKLQKIADFLKVNISEFGSDDDFDVDYLVELEKRGVLIEYVRRKEIDTVALRYAEASPNIKEAIRKLLDISDCE